MAIHDLRHSCAALAVSAGANVLALQRMLGHTSAKVTLDVYAELFDSDLDSLASSLDIAYAPGAIRSRFVTRTVLPSGRRRAIGSASLCRRLSVERKLRRISKSLTVFAISSATRAIFSPSWKSILWNRSR